MASFNNNKNNNILWFNTLTNQDIAKVGGKNASLGEMISTLSQYGIKIPEGFATTAYAYREFLKQNNLQKKINLLLENLDINNLDALEKTGAQIRQWIIETPLLPDFIQEIQTAYLKLTANNPNATFAVRSSATAEDLPDASFAGQQETYLNISHIENILLAIKKVFASLYNNRAIAYRVHNNFEHSKIALSVGIELMVRSDLGASGVAFSIDTESGFQNVIFINAAWGLGETIVQGAVNPDEYYIYKPNIINNKPAILLKKLGEKAVKMIYQHNTSQITTEIIPTSIDERKKFALTNDELQKLAKYIILIEQHYKCPMDIEWAKDGNTGELYIVQARPETVKSRENKQIIKQYQLKNKTKIIVEGRAVGELIGKGKAKILQNVSEITRINTGDILVTDMTDPDWEPIMKKAAAIITNRGGRTCHAAIIARELGIPAIIGCGNATSLIKDGTDITVSCAEGETGRVYEGILDY